MGTHLIPRDVEGEARILIIFTQKGFIYTLVAAVIGTILYKFIAAARSYNGSMGSVIHLCFNWFCIRTS